MALICVMMPRVQHLQGVSTCALMTHANSSPKLSRLAPFKMGTRDAHMNSPLKSTGKTGESWSCWCMSLPVCACTQQAVEQHGGVTKGFAQAMSSRGTCLIAGRIQEAQHGQSRVDDLRRRPIKFHGICMPQHQQLPHPCTNQCTCYMLRPGVTQEHAGAHQITTLCTTEDIS